MMGQPPQQVFLVPLLLGTDGSMKMSKSLGNYIGIDEPPNEMYGEVMSISDALMMDYFELLTDVPDEELEEFRRELAAESVNPMLLKKRLAREIVTQFHSAGAAREAEAEFERVVQKGEAPEEVLEVAISFEEFWLEASPRAVSEAISGEDMEEAIVVRGRDLRTGKVDLTVSIPFFLHKIGLVESKSEAKRLIAQGAVEVDGRRVTTETASNENIHDGTMIKVGKRRFRKIVNADKKT